VARSPDHATLLTEGLLFLDNGRPSVKNVAWSGDHATTDRHFRDSHLNNKVEGRRISFQKRGGESAIALLLTLLY
jgi:hypothetical protein